MKRINITLTLIFIGSQLLFSQVSTVNDSIKKDTVISKIKKDTIPKKRTFFLDENSLGITEKTFNDKCGAAVFYCKRFDKDNMIVFKVYERMLFGKLSKKEYNQLRIYLNRKSIKQTPENHQILIHYEEQLIGFKESNENCNLVNDKSLKENYEVFNKQALANNEYPFESIKNFQRFVRSHRLEFHNEEKFNQEIATYAKQQNNCIKKVETKFQTPVYYVVNDNYNYPIKNEYFNWVVDGGAIKSTFIKKHPDTDLIIIRPNGEYFIKSDVIPDFVLNKILKSENWFKFISDWKNSKIINHPYGVGIVEAITKPYEFYNSNCY